MSAAIVGPLTEPRRTPKAWQAFQLCLVTDALTTTTIDDDGAAAAEPAAIGVAPIVVDVDVATGLLHLPQPAANAASEEEEEEEEDEEAPPLL
jgi:hypothetical protein